MNHDHHEEARAAPGHIPGRAGDVLNTINEIHEHLARFQEVYAEQEHAQEELLRRGEELRRVEREIDEREQALTDRWQQMEARFGEIEQREHELAEKTRMADRAAELDRALKETCAELEEARRQSERDVAAARAEMDRRIVQHVEEARKATAGAEEARRRIGQLERELEEALRSLEDAEKRANHLVAPEVLDEAQRRASQAEKTLAQSRERIADLERTLGQTREELSEVRRHAAEADRAREQGERAAEEAQSLARKVSQLEAEVVEATRRGEQTARQWRDSVEAARAEAERAVAQRDEIGETLATTEAQLASAREKLKATRAELTEACNRRDELEIEVDAGRARLVAHSARSQDAHVEQRRARLHNIRRELRERVAKARRAEQIIAQKYEQCEQILAQRDELASVTQRLAQRRRQIDSVSLGSKVGWTVCSLAAALAIAAGFSWVVAGKISPATYAAKAVIAADGRTRVLTDAQRAEWQRYHQELLLDPVLLEQAAERMSRRGLTTLGSAAELKARLESDLTHDSAEAGSLGIELRGVGAERTQRELDTYVTALVSRSNAMRDSRVDGAATVVKTVAEAGQEPISDARTIYAGGIFAALVGGLSALGVALWRRLAAAKLQYERDADMVWLKEEERWALPKEAA